MKTLTIRNVPDRVYERLARLASSSRRSLQQQVLLILENTRAEASDPSLQQAASIRKRLEARDLGDTVAEVRQERMR